MKNLTLTLIAFTCLSLPLLAQDTLVTPVTNDSIQTVDNPYIGVYDISIYMSNGQKLLDLGYVGKLYITETGVTITSDCPYIKEERGTYAQSSIELKPGQFYGNLSTNYKESTFMLVMNEKKTSGSITIGTPYGNETTIFMIPSNR